MNMVFPLLGEREKKRKERQGTDSPVPGIPSLLHFFFYDVPYVDTDNEDD